MKLKNYGPWAGWRDRSLPEAEVVAKESGQTLAHGEVMMGSAEERKSRGHVTRKGVKL